MASAKSSGVWPSAFLAWRSAPRWMSRAARPGSPASAARCRGRLRRPPPIGASTSAPQATSSSASASFLVPAARCKGAWPNRVAAFTSAPAQQRLGNLHLPGLHGPVQRRVAVGVPGIDRRPGGQELLDDPGVAGPDGPVQCRLTVLVRGRQGAPSARSRRIVAAAPSRAASKRAWLILRSSSGAGRGRRILVGEARHRASAGGGRVLVRPGRRGAEAGSPHSRSLRRAQVRRDGARCRRSPRLNSPLGRSKHRSR